jgi:hypothetical protein
MTSLIERPPDRMASKIKELFLALTTWSRKPNPKLSLPILRAKH